MIISSREELISLLNEQAVETYVLKSRPGVKMMHTIIYDKYKDRHYRIEWGEISDESGINHLWYEEEAQPVFLNKTIRQKGWCAKDEINDGIEPGVDLREHSYYRVEKNIVENTHNLENITIWGTKAGQGKTRYAISKVAERLMKGEVVLFFSTEESQEEIMRRIARTIDNLGHNSDEAMKSANIKIYNNYQMNDNYIIDKMRTQAASPEGLDFVVIDHLHLSNGIGGNYNEIVKIHNKLDNEAINLKCEALITTQLNANS